MNNKKHCVSVRLKHGDLLKIEQLASRLNVRNSDVIRYAIKSTLNNLIPLHDNETHGYRLLPAIIDHCHELNRHFDLDADQLDRIINGGSRDEDERVQRHDIELLSLCGLAPEHIKYRFQEITGQDAHIDEIPQLLKEYLISKYETGNSRNNNKLPATAHQKGRSTINQPTD